jgi:hypothetical protein
VVTAPVWEDEGQDFVFGRSFKDSVKAIGLPENPDAAWREIHEYLDILLERKPSPINAPHLQLQELATAYYARALEIDALIHQAERKGIVGRGSDWQKFRTGELASFINIARKCADLGSRRLSEEQLLHDQRGSI